MKNKKIETFKRKSDSKSKVGNTLSQYWKAHDNSKIYIPFLLLLLTYGALYILFKSLAPLDTQLLYMIIFFFLATSIGFSGLYLGAHYPLDIIIGAINRTLTGVLLINLCERFGVGRG